METNKIAKLRKAVHHGEIDISSPSDKKAAIVCAMEVVSEGCLLVCDCANKKVKLFDEDSEVLSEVTLTSEPRGMITFELTDVIVSLPNEKLLQKLRISKDNTVILHRRIQTRLRCSKLVAFETQFIAYAYDDIFRYFNVMDRDGHEIRSIIKMKKDSAQLFDNIRFLTLNTDNKILYVTDATSGCIGLTLNGKIVFKMKNNGTLNCWGVATDSTGCVYTALYDADKIVINHNSSENPIEVVAQKHLRPCAIYYSEDDRLYVKKGGANLVLIYGVI